MQFAFSIPEFKLPLAEKLKGSDDAMWVSATDGDTPKVALPIRMLGMDAPEYHYQGADQENPGKFDAAMRGFLVGAGSQLDAGLRAYLEPRLKGKPCTRQIRAGEKALRHFEALKRQRLDPGQRHNEKRKTERRLYIMVAQEVFDKHGRMLAYINASYNQAERKAIPPAERPTFNLQMMQEGQAVSLLIYPNIPKASDLELVQKAVSEARTAPKGFWQAGQDRVLLPYEFRWIVDTIQGARMGPDRYCGDILSGKLFPPQSYHLVWPENRLFFRAEHLKEALKMGFSKTW
jgi:endonuclease YncB( thermonuclease family)